MKTVYTAQRQVNKGSYIPVLVKFLKPWLVSV